MKTRFLRQLYARAVLGLAVGVLISIVWLPTGVAVASLGEVTSTLVAIVIGSATVCTMGTIVDRLRSVRPIGGTMATALAYFRIATTVLLILGDSTFERGSFRIRS